MKELIIAAAWELGRPTTGEFAGLLWELCSGSWHLPVAEGKKLYQDCGYVPFSGYPLLRSAVNRT